MRRHLSAKRQMRRGQTDDFFNGTMPIVSRTEPGSFFIAFIAFFLVIKYTKGYNWIICLDCDDAEWALPDAIAQAPLPHGH